MSERLDDPSFENYGIGRYTGDNPSQSSNGDNDAGNDNPSGFPGNSSNGDSFQNTMNTATNRFQFSLPHMIFAHALNKKYPGSVDQEYLNNGYDHVRNTYAVGLSIDNPSNGTNQTEGDVQATTKNAVLDPVAENAESNTAMTIGAGVLTAIPAINALRKNAFKWGNLLKPVTPFLTGVSIGDQVLSFTDPVPQTTPKFLEDGEEPEFRRMTPTDIKQDAARIGLSTGVPVGILASPAIGLTTSAAVGKAAELALSLHPYTKKHYYYTREDMGLPPSNSEEREEFDKLHY